MKNSFNSILDFTTPTESPGDVRVSYSQFTMWINCPKKWKLTYMDGHKEDEPSIHLLFGTSMHETIQEWLKTLFTKSPLESDEMDLGALLRDTMAREYKSLLENRADLKDWITKSQMNEFYLDGIEILNELKKSRVELFSTRKWKLFGIETKLYQPIVKGMENIKMISYLDLVFEEIETGNILIVDIKTSTNGWNSYQKADETKTAQLILYKHFFSQQFGIEYKKIDVKYLILKRKLNEAMMYNVTRLQKFSPTNGGRTIKKTLKMFEDFVKEAFNNDGSHRVDNNFPATAGFNNKQCKFCPFKSRYDLCPKTDRIKTDFLLSIYRRKDESNTEILQEQDYDQGSINW